MRRGHFRSSSWRNDNPRHFRGHNGNFSNARPAGLPHASRVPSLPRHRSNQNFNTRSHDEEYSYQDNYDNTNFRNFSRNQPTHRHQEQNYNQRNNFESGHRQPHYNKPFKGPPNYHENSNQCLVNTMGDYDQRQISRGDVDLRQGRSDFDIRHGTIGDINKRPFTYQQNQSLLPSPWIKPPNQHYDINKTVRYDSMDQQRPTELDYTGHRPPSSDHYDCNSGSKKDDINLFSKSVDDTVDIVRKRLLNREVQLVDENPPNAQVHSNNVNNEMLDQLDHSSTQPTQKKIIRRQHSVKSNCDKMKSKIVHQLFKIDKDKMQKLMDNPNSSSKFEFAISSLITESQNSLNKQKRSIAEKSLFSSSSEFMQNENTIYEDTFMKQMQCMFEPHDTVLLEDIKPMVMAELSRVLQMQDYDQRFESFADIHQDQDQLDNNVYCSNAYNDENEIYSDLLSDSYNYQYEDSIQNKSNNSIFVTQSNISYVSPEKDVKVLYTSPTKFDFAEKRQASIERRRQSRKSEDSVINDEKLSIKESTPLFSLNNIEQGSDDDPFAELDNQYHVEVDPDFIENKEVVHGSPPQIPYQKTNLRSAKNNYSNTQIPTQKPIQEVTKEIDTELLNILEFSFEKPQETNKVNQMNISNELIIESENETIKSMMYVNRDKPGLLKTKKQSSNLRKRTSDQSISHHKEKRKKNSTQSDVPTINVDECTNQSDSQNSSVHLFFSKQQKDLSKDRTDSNKHVRKKETTKKNKKDKASSHSVTIVNNQTPTKQDNKTKLKPIDMFVGQPRKLSLHQAHRNTASLTGPPASLESNKNDINKKAKPCKIDFSMQFSCKTKTKSVQTEKKVKTTRASQTEPIQIRNEKKPKATDTFERMKEIDLEIQALVQEKFKLYNSVESNDICSNNMQNLGITVLNVNPSDENNADSLSGDAIVNEFTSIPVDELEQIAFECIDQQPLIDSCNTKSEQKDMLEDIEINTTPSTKKRNIKKPNISLIEQIIIDDTPLDDLITLDDLEITSIKHKKKTKPVTSKKKNNKKTTSQRLLELHKKFDIKPCSVLITKEDYLNNTIAQSEGFCEDERTDLKIINNPVMPIITENVEVTFEMPGLHSCEVIEENDIHFDMLDVSEDIVIGDVYEIKSSDNKDFDERDNLTEDIILDNSQSSSDEVVHVDPEHTSEICKVFDYSADDKLRRDSLSVSGHADAILAIECVDNNFVAASLDGNVYYFNGEGTLISTLKGSNLAVTCLTIVKEKHGTTVYTGSLDSRIRFYDLETCAEKGPECNVLSPIQTMDRAWDTVFVGTRTGFVLQFECKNNMLIPVSTVKFSEQSILALRAMKEGPRKVLLVAARSENVTIKDAQTGLLLRTLMGPKMTVYTLLYEDGKVYCGTSSHQIHVFDYTSGSHMGTHEGGKGAVCLRASGGLVFSGCYDGCVYVYREGSRTPFAQLKGPNLMLLSLALHGSKIIAGYKDRSLYIWKIPHSILQEMIL